MTTSTTVYSAAAVDDQLAAQAASVAATYASLPQSAKNGLTGWYHANGYGATGNGSTDDTTSLNTWLAAIPSGGHGYLPSGTYKVTGALTQPANGVTIEAAGEGAQLSYQPASAGTMWTLTNASRVKFVGVEFVLPGTTAGAGSRLFKLANSFHNSWHRCVFQGQHTTSGDSYGVTTGHIGVAITNNAGDNMWYDCDFLNLGVGIITDSIQNSVNGGKFGTCYVGIYGTSNIDSDSQAGAGMSITGYVVFVSSSTAGLVKNNIWVDGAANHWWISHCWLEGADTPILIGDTSGNGPVQFGITNSKLAATTAGIKIQTCRQAYLANVVFSPNGAATPTPLIVDATNAPQGTAVNLINTQSGIGADPFLTAFPNGTASTTAGWTYLGRAQMQLPTLTLMPYGGSLRFIRSDGATAGQISLSGSALTFKTTASTSSTAICTFIDNANKVILSLDQVSAAVNYLTVKNNIAGSAPAITAGGTDTNVDINLAVKGAGRIVAQAPVVFPTYTTTARNALTNLAAGATVYDSTLGYLVTYSGSAWKNQAGTTV